MSMQDNDIDGLFRSKLDSMEVEPSARVWKGIVVELDGAKQKRTLIPVIRIAATITVILGIGLFFLLKGSQGIEDRVTKATIQKKHVIISQSKTDNNVDEETIANRVQPTSTGQQLTAEAVKPVQENVQQINNSTVKVVKYPEAVATTKHSLKEAKQQQQETIQEPSTIAEPYTLAAATNNDNNITQPVVPDEPLNIEKPVIQGPDEFKTAAKPVLVQLPASKTKTPAKKHGIRSFGDLINVVVAKVDKRQDKVIEFSDTDGDESMITGLNLGILKVKKDK